jgi:hypothetical protein
MKFRDLAADVEPLRLKRCFYAVSDSAHDAIASSVWQGWTLVSFSPHPGRTLSLVPGPWLGRMWL